MSKDEFLKIQTCVLKVNIHCDGCKHKVKRILQKIEGVYTTKIDSDQGKVTVSGNIDANHIIKKLIKNGKHAELWGAKPSNNNHQNQLNNQFKNLQIGGKGGGGGGNNKGQAQKGGGNNQPKGGGGGGGGGGGQGQHMHQIKGFQDMKKGPNFMKDLKGSSNGKENLKTVKFKLPEDEDLSDDEFDDDEFDDDDELDDEFDDEMAHAPPHKMKPAMGSSPHMMGGQIPPHGSANGGHGGANGKKGGGGGGAPNGGVGKKGGNGNNGSGQNKNGGGGGHGGGGAAFMAAKKVNDGPHGMPNMMGMNGGGNMGIRPSGGNMGVRPMGQMGQMGKLAAVQGLPAAAMGGAGGGADHTQVNNNPYYQQQLAAMMMNQQRANGNERFQPMMYARPPPAVNYMPPYPAYPYPPPLGERADQYAMFSDENTSSCRVM